MPKTRVELLPADASNGQGVRVEMSQPSPGGRPVALPLYPQLDPVVARQVAAIRLWRVAPSKQYLGHFEDERGRIDEEWIRVSFGGGIYASKLANASGQIIGNTEKTTSIDGPPKDAGASLLAPASPASPPVDIERVVERLLAPVQERAERDRHEWERRVAEAEAKAKRERDDERERRKAEIEEARERSRIEQAEREERHKQDLERTRLEHQQALERAKADHERALERDRLLFGALQSTAQEQTKVVVAALQSKGSETEGGAIERGISLARDMMEMTSGTPGERMADKAIAGLDRLGALVASDDRRAQVSVQRGHPSPAARPNPSPAPTAPSTVPGNDIRARFARALDKIGRQIEAGGENPLDVLEDVAEGRLKMTLSEPEDEENDSGDEPQKDAPDASPGDAGAGAPADTRGA